jgi:collagen type VI alpha
MLQVYVQFHLNQYRSKYEIVRAVDRIQYQYGSTNTADAIKEMRENMFIPNRGDRADVRNVAVIITGQWIQMGQVVVVTVPRWGK